MGVSTRCAASEEADDHAWTIPGSVLRVAIVHDDLTQRGGAEQVVLALHRLFPDAPILTTVYDPERTYPDFEDLDVRVTPLQRLPHGEKAARGLLPLYPWAIGRIDATGHDLVVSSSSRFAHGVDAGDAYHLCYCHNPPRWLYQTDEYVERGGPVPRWARPLLRPLFPILRRWDQRAATRPDLYVANSRVVAERIARVYGRDAEIVYPPVRRERFTTPHTSAGLTDEPYYLVVSRLLPYKRIDLAVRAAEARGVRLVVVGSGPAEADLRAAAGSHTEFRHDIGDAEMAALLTNCRALVQPGLEDFGLVPLEANTAGRPVIAYGLGGALESVVDGVTGIHFPEQSVDALVDAMERLEARTWNGAALRTYAKAASEDQFRRDLVHLLHERDVLSCPASDAPYASAAVRSRR